MKQVKISSKTSIVNQIMSNFMKQGFSGNFISGPLQKIFCRTPMIMIVMTKQATHCIFLNFLQRQQSSGVLSKRCSEDMQQIYRRTPIPKCDFNKVAIKITLQHGYSPVNLLDILRTPFSKNTSGWLLLFLVIYW